MRVRHAAVVLPLVLAAGVALVRPDTSHSKPSQSSTSQGSAAQPEKKPAPAAPSESPPSNPASAAPAKTTETQTPAPSGKPSQPAAAEAAPDAPLDLNGLEQELKDTEAIGFFTKISLKNQVDDLLDRFRDFYRGKGKLTLAELRRSYDLLVMKVLSLLQDEDQKLASKIVASREGIWNLLADPTTFKALTT